MSATVSATPAPDAAAALRDLAAGRSSALTELYRHHLPMLRARTRRYGLQDADAVDAIQTTWLRLTENADRIHTPEHLAGWLATTVSRECLRILRLRSRVVADDDAGLAAAPPAPAVDDQGVEARLAAADREALAAALAQLSPQRRRLLLTLFADDAPPYAQVARDCGMPVGSIGPTRARSLAQLRALLQQRAGTDPGDVPQRASATIW